MNSTIQFPPASSSQNPVTWHVIVWVLLSLSINSMAQPAGAVCGISTRYRIYLRSSPIICCADALSMVLILATMSVYLRISPRKATHLILVARFAKDHKEQEVGEEQRREVQELKHNTWFRWLFFILGALPAAIKLSSFTGVPWTQAWGMMFMSSFATIELITLLSSSDQRDRFSIPEALGYTALEWQDSQHNELRSKITLLSKLIIIFQDMLIVIGFAAHAVVGIWAFVTAWMECSATMVSSTPVGDIMLRCETVFFIAITLAILVYLIAFVFGSDTSVGRRLPVKSIAWAACRVFFLIVVFRRRSGKKADEWAVKLASVIVFGIIFYSGYYLLSYLSRQFPGLSRALLVDRPPAPARSPTSTELQVSAVDQKDPIDEVAWAALSFFCFNLIVCVLWYAFKYDRTDTFNPAWTDVFG